MSPQVKPTLLVAAGIVIENGRVLVTRRKDQGSVAGAWEFPGGKVELGEDPRDTVVRELREEIGIETVAGEIFDVTFHAYAEKRVLLMFFLATRTHDSPPPTAIHVAAVKWAAHDELDPQPFLAADVAVLAKVAAWLRSHPPIDQRADY